MTNNNPKSMSEVLEELRTTGAVNTDLYAKMKHAIETDSKVSSQLIDPKDRVSVASMLDLISMSSSRVRAGLLAMATAPVTPLSRANLGQCDSSADVINVVAKQSIFDAMASVQAFRNAACPQSSTAAADVVDVQAKVIPTNHTGANHE